MTLLAAAQVGPVEAALIGACGALIGGLLTSSANVFTDWRRARRDREAERRRTERDLRRSARLVAEELADIALLLTSASDAERYGARDGVLRADAWERGREVLAAALDDEAWASASVAYGHLRRLDSLIQQRARGLPEGRAPSVLSEDALDEAVAAVRTAESALRGVSESAAALARRD